MRKDSADQIKAQYQADHDYEEVIALLGEEEVEERLGLLDAVEDLLSEEIASFALDLTQDLIDEEDTSIVRVFWLSKGMEDTFIAINDQIQIKSWDPEIPLALLGEIAITLSKTTE